MLNSMRGLRASNGWSQGDLASRLGVSRQTVHAIEADKCDPSLPLAFAIAKLFERTIEDIFQPDTPAAPQPVVRPPQRDFID